MKKKHLDKTIKELHAELKKTEPADDHVRGHIERLILEIELLREEPGEIPLDRYQQFLERLKESAQHFEASHLSLTLAVGRVIDALSNMGI
jgi:regulatory protein YycH of two-component signal transduction system YycFG